MVEVSEWYRTTRLGDECCSDEHCSRCSPNGDCEGCGTIDGRFMEVVNEYASTCDACGELTSHTSMQMDPLTQLGYCPDCVRKLPKEILDRL